MPGKKRKNCSKAPPVRKTPSLMEKEPPVKPSRGKYRKWTNESMLGAMKAVQEGSMGLNRAALQYNVPKATLSDRLSGRVTHGCKSGKAPYLTMEEEKELHDWLILCANIGYPKRRDDVLGIVRKALETKSGSPLEDFTGKGWWLRFMERWPDLHLRKANALAQPRANAVNSDNTKNYFA